MITYQGNNAEDLTILSIKALALLGEHRIYANQEIIKLPVPATLIYKKPQQCIGIQGITKSNPFFSIMAAISLLAGIDYYPWLSQFDYKNKNKAFSKNAYGVRLRSAWGDQVSKLTELIGGGGNAGYIGHLHLRSFPAVVDDSCPCIDISFKIEDEKLNMYLYENYINIFDESEFIGFSFLQQYMAKYLNIEMGVCFRIITDLYIKKEEMPLDIKSLNTRPYPFIVPLVHNIFAFDREIKKFIGFNHRIANPFNYDEPFVKGTLIPMANCYNEFRAGNIDSAFNWIENIKNFEWAIVSYEWIRSAKNENF